ncbi:MAG: 50S ribosomal protein L32 [Bernardetiaceae bacterium]
MAHPKRKISKTRRDKRRTHQKLDAVPVALCQETGEPHRYHRAHQVDGKWYYRGRLIVDLSGEDAIEEIE